MLFRAGIETLKVDFKAEWRLTMRVKGSGTTCWEPKDGGRPVTSSRANYSTDGRLALCSQPAGANTTG